ncbi:MAG: AAA family ATPase [Deltaproteobacteria bacterium]|nr:AAA family ATPase [Deltaproteobacteria bacterium]
MSASDRDDILPVVRAADIDGVGARPRWLVASLWARAGVGILGGAPKCCKSWLALEMAVAVASGASCLGVFAVGDVGPALLYMAEDAAPIVKTRLAGICRHRGLELASLPIHLITAPALRLDRAHDQVRLRDAVAKYAPRMLVLDPFVRLHRIDENDAGQVSALLGYLRELQRAHDVAVLVVHHARKNGTAGQPGQSLRGSGDFFAWADSLLYVRRHRGQLMLAVEHRGAPAPDPIQLALAADDDDVHLEVATGDVTDDAETGTVGDRGGLDRAIVEALTQASGPLGRGQLRALLRVRNERVGEALTRLVDRGVVLREGDRFAVPDSRHP